MIACSGTKGVTAMKKLLMLSAVLCCFAVPAHAMNSKMYKCGDVDVKLAIVKDTGKVVGRNVYFRVKLRGDYPTMKDGMVRVAPFIKFREIDDITEFAIAGAKY